MKILTIQAIGLSSVFEGHRLSSFRCSLSLFPDLFTSTKLCRIPVILHENTRLSVMDLQHMYWTRSKMSTTIAQETDLDHQKYSVNIPASLKKPHQSKRQKTFRNPKKPLNPTSPRNEYPLSQLRRTPQCRDLAELRMTQRQELLYHQNTQGASIKPTFFASINSTESIPSAPHLSIIIEPPDSDIAQLWHLVRLTSAQRPRQATSIIPSHKDNIKFRFCHKLPDIIPSEISIPLVSAIKEELQKL